jgi:hypothetical protein
VVVCWHWLKEENRSRFLSSPPIGVVLWMMKICWLLIASVIETLSVGVDNEKQPSQLY